MIKLLTSKTWRARFISVALLLCAAALVLSPQEAIEGAKEGLSLCFNVIIPSLFPFFVLSSLVVDLGLAAQLGKSLEPFMKPLFRVNGSCGAALALGFVGGYPVGARTALQLYQQGQCTKTEAERLLAFCNNSGPAFILGVVGVGIFADNRVGLLLYLTHAAASLLVGLLFRFYKGHDCSCPQPQYQKPIKAMTLPAAFTGAVTRSFQNILNICAFIIFFSVALRLITSYGILGYISQLLTLLGFQPEWGKRLAAGLLELSSGVSSLSGPGSFTGKTSMAAFMLGWAGLSVHCQVLSFLADSGLSARVYLFGKLCHGLLAAGLTWLIVSLTPFPSPVSHYLSEETEALASLSFSSVLPTSIAASLAIWFLLSSIYLPVFRKKGRKTSPNTLYCKKP